MTTLSRAISAVDTSIIVSPALTSSAPYPFALTLESEALLVNGGNGTRTLFVSRGQDGTTAATHAAGVTVTTGWSGGSSVQTVSRIGPFNVTFNEVAAGARKSLVALASNVAVIVAWAEIVTPWDHDPDAARVTVAVGPDTIDTAAVFRGLIGENQVNSPTAASAAPAYDQLSVSGLDPGNVVQPFSNAGVQRMTAPGFLVASVSSNAAATAGELNIYALVATPS